jgi:dTDP-4-amino-4,6-dideoxy-D-galactose acyltransferase
VLVVRVDGKPSGFLAVLRSDDAHVIDLIAIAAEARGRGAGRALVAHLLATSPQRVDVGTQIANVGALRFYERLGFEVTETRYVLHCHR